MELRFEGDGRLRRRNRSEDFAAAGHSGAVTNRGSDRGSARGSDVITVSANESPWIQRFVAGYMTEGPRVRMGIVWFVAVVVAAAVGMVAVAVLFGALAGVAAIQTASSWRRTGYKVNPLIAGISAALIPLGATLGIGLAGVAALLVVGVSLVASVIDSDRNTSVVVRTGVLVRSSFFVGLAAGAAVLIARTDAAALVTLLVLVSGYEVGDYLVGTGANNPVEGPVAGIAAVLVLTFAISVFEFAPFETGSAWVFGGLATALAPLGPFVASALVPAADAPVPALRRLDSWLLVAPIWMWMLWSYLL